MSLEQFQRAFAELVASPPLCLAVQSGPELLDEYTLTSRERERLHAMASHPGMSHNCTLYRANRLTPIARCLPATCLHLGPRLRAEFDNFLATSSDAFDLQFRGEAERFARYLNARLAGGAIEDPELRRCLDRELLELAEDFDPLVQH
jgi:hypothetical protein